MSCSTIETEVQAQIWHQIAPLEYQLWSISKAKRIFSPIAPKGGSIGLLRGRQKHQKLASFSTGAGHTKFSNFQKCKKKWGEMPPRLRSWYHKKAEII